MWGPNAVMQSPILHWSVGYPTARQLVDCRDRFLLGNFSHVLSQRTKFLGLSTNGRTARYPDLFSVNTLDWKRQSNSFRNSSFDIFITLLPPSIHPSHSS